MFEKIKSKYWLKYFGIILAFFCGVVLVVLVIGSHKNSRVVTDYNDAMLDDRSNTFCVRTVASDEWDISHLADLIQVSKNHTSVVEFKGNSVIVSDMDVLRGPKLSAQKWLKRNQQYSLKGYPNGWANRIEIVLDDKAQFTKIFKRKYSESHDTSEAVYQTLMNSKLKENGQYFSNTKITNTKRNAFAESGLCFSQPNSHTITTHYEDFSWEISNKYGGFDVNAFYKGRLERKISAYDFWAVNDAQKFNSSFNKLNPDKFFSDNANVTTEVPDITKPL